MVGLTSGANYENTSMVNHYNQTGRWLSTFRSDISMSEKGFENTVYLPFSLVALYSKNMTQ